MGKNSVLIFTKAPSSGQVKTRLTSNTCLTYEEAALLAKAMLMDTLTFASKSKADKIEIGYYPFKELSLIQEIVETVRNDGNLKKKVEFQLQKGENFDERFGSVVESSFSSGSSRVIVLGADLPYMNFEIINLTFDKLNFNNETNRVPIVLGPASEGGIYLVGLTSSFIPDWFTKYQLFRGGVEMEQFIYLVRKKKLHLSLLPPLYDIDIEVDLISLLSFIDAYKNSNSFEDFFFPKYTDEIINDLGLYIQITNGQTRRRKLAKKKSI